MQTLKRLTDILCEELDGDKKSFYNIRAGPIAGRNDRYVAIYILKYVYGYESKHIYKHFGYKYNDIITYAKRYVEKKQKIRNYQKMLDKVSSKALERFHSGE